MKKPDSQVSIYMHSRKQQQQQHNTTTTTKTPIGIKIDSSCQSLEWKKRVSGKGLWEL